ncbi:MAG TPA: NFACT RNA binding domain-containing protein [Myxococcales bacterium]|nr:NFACT RNA binding domain-containing protein [Myxococcales bacterium]
MQSPLTDEQKQRLLAELLPLRGAALQKLWLPSASLCVLHLRIPGKTQLAIIDGHLGLAALADERPISAEGAPKSQAALRNALEGARLLSVRLMLASDRRAPSPWIGFESPQGPRTLVAEAAAGGGGALLLLDAEQKILWAASGAQRRPGSQFPEARELPLSTAGALPERAALVREALEGEEEAGLAARRKQTVALLKSRTVKARRTLAAVEADSARAAGASESLAQAELLLPHASRIPRGVAEVKLPDWTQTDENGTPREVTLKLDPALSAAENASRWLKKSKRYLSAAARIAARHQEVERDLARAEELLRRASSAPDAAALLAVEAETGPAPVRRNRAADAPRVPYRTFKSQSGAKVLVGRGARDNDSLTFKTARGNDLWLHARTATGAHVVVPGVGESPDARTLGDAALLAAHFSSLRGEAGAEVAWTRCKYVRKPRGAPPGSVIMTQEKTLRVRLDADRLALLLKSET